MLERLLDSIYSALDKTPNKQAALVVRHSDGLRWSVSSRRLVIGTEAGASLGSFDLTTFTISELAARLRGAGCVVSYVNQQISHRLAAVLLEGSGVGSADSDTLYAYDSLLWSLLDAYAVELEKADYSIAQAVADASLSDSTGVWLSYWGEIFGIRRGGRSDAAYRQHIVDEVRMAKLNPFAIEKAVLRVTGLRVEIDEPWKRLFRLSGSKLSEDYLYDGVRWGPHLMRPVNTGVNNIDWGQVLPVIRASRPAGVILLSPEWRPPPMLLGNPSRGVGAGVLRIDSAYCARSNNGQDAAVGFVDMREDSFAYGIPNSTGPTRVISGRGFPIGVVSEFSVSDPVVTLLESFPYGLSGGGLGLEGAQNSTNSGSASHDWTFTHARVIGGGSISPSYGYFLATPEGGASTSKFLSASAPDFLLAKKNAGHAAGGNVDYSYELEFDVPRYDYGYYLRLSAVLECRKNSSASEFSSSCSYYFLQITLSEFGAMSGSFVFGAWNNASGLWSIYQTGNLPIITTDHIYGTKLLKIQKTNGRFEVYLGTYHVGSFAFGSSDLAPGLIDGVGADTGGMFGFGFEDNYTSGVEAPLITCKRMKITQ